VSNVCLIYILISFATVSKNPHNVGKEQTYIREIKLQDRDRYSGVRDRDRDNGARDRDETQGPIQFKTVQNE